jgi:hypothetical protein
MQQNSIYYSHNINVLCSSWKLLFSGSSRSSVSDNIFVTVESQSAVSLYENQFKFKKNDANIKSFEPGWENPLNLESTVIIQYDSLLIISPG